MKTKWIVILTVLAGLAVLTTAGIMIFAVRDEESIPKEVPGVTYKFLTEQEVREKLPGVVDKWKKNHDMESLVWLYAEVVSYPERCMLKTRKDVVEIFGEPDWKDERGFGYSAKDGFFAADFETEKDDLGTIIGHSKQP